MSRRKKEVDRLEAELAARWAREEAREARSYRKHREDEIAKLQARVDAGERIDRRNPSHTPTTLRAPNYCAVWLERQAEAAMDRAHAEGRKVRILPGDILETILKPLIAAGDLAASGLTFSEIAMLVEALGPLAVGTEIPTDRECPEPPSNLEVRNAYRGKTA